MPVDLTGIPPQPVDTLPVRDVLLDDYAACWIALKNEDSQVRRRSYVRAAFAFIEGTIAVFKSDVLKEFLAGRCSLSVGEVTTLLEKSYYLTDQGAVNDRDAFSTVAPTIRFTLDLFARAHGVPARLDYSDDRWRSLRRAIDIRNRITHPKVTTDLDISDDELRDVDRGVDWFFDANLAVYVAGKAALIVRLNQMKVEHNTASQQESKSAENR